MHLERQKLALGQKWPQAHICRAQNCPPLLIQNMRRLFISDSSRRVMTLAFYGLSRIIWATTCLYLNTPKYTTNNTYSFPLLLSFLYLESKHAFWKSQNCVLVFSLIAFAPQVHGATQTESLFTIFLHPQYRLSSSFWHLWGAHYTIPVAQACPLGPNTPRSSESHQITDSTTAEAAEMVRQQTEQNTSTRTSP